MTLGAVAAALGALAVVSLREPSGDEAGHPPGDLQPSLERILSHMDGRIRALRAFEADGQTRLRSSDVALSLSVHQHGARSEQALRLRDENHSIQNELGAARTSLELLLRARRRLLRLQDARRREAGSLPAQDRQFLIGVERFLAQELEHAGALASSPLELLGDDLITFPHEPDSIRAIMSKPTDEKSTTVLDALSAETRARLRELDVEFDVQLASLDLDALELPNGDARKIRAHLATRTPFTPPDIRRLVGGVPREEVDLDAMEDSQ